MSTILIYEEPSLFCDLGSYGSLTQETEEGKKEKDRKKWMINRLLQKAIYILIGASGAENSPDLSHIQNALKSSLNAALVFSELLQAVSGRTLRAGFLNQVKLHKNLST